MHSIVCEPVTESSKHFYLLNAWNSVRRETWNAPITRWVFKQLELQQRGWTTKNKIPKASTVSLLTHLRLSWAELDHLAKVTRHRSMNFKQFIISYSKLSVYWHEVSLNINWIKSVKTKRTHRKHRLLWWYGNETRFRDKTNNCETKSTSHQYNFLFWHLNFERFDSDKNRPDLRFLEPYLSLSRDTSKISWRNSSPPHSSKWQLELQLPIVTSKLCTCQNLRLGSVVDLEGYQSRIRIYHTHVHLPKSNS